MANNFYKIRAATPDDAPLLTQLIAVSAHALSIDYTVDQIEAALGSAFGLDSQLIRDATYYVATVDDIIVACGGWSRRAKLFGSDKVSAGGDGATENLLNPTCDAARIRAFFIHPQWARRGLGRALLAHCESEAAREGFRRIELVATLAGQRLYQNYGYQSAEPFGHTLQDGTVISFVPMRKELV